MNRNDAFSRCHPLVNFLYFALVLLGAMLLQHPVCQAISLIGAIACFCTLGGEKPGGFRLCRSGKAANIAVLRRCAGMNRTTR